MPLMLPESDLQEEYTLHCKHCGGADGSVSSVSAHPRSMEDGIHVWTTVNLSCSQCHRVSCFAIADCGGVVKVLSVERVRL